MRDSPQITAQFVFLVDLTRANYLGSSITQTSGDTTMTSFRPFRVLFFAQFCIAVVAGISIAGDGPHFQDDEVFKIKTEQKVFDWAFDPATNRVFGSILDSDEVIEYSPTMGTTVRKFSVGKKPEKMLVKGKRLLVLCQQPSQVVSINLSSNEVEAKIPVDCKNLCDISTAGQENNLVYLFTAHSGQYGDPLIYKLDLDSKKIVETLKESQSNREYVVNGVISELGTGLLFDRRGYVSPSGAFFATVNADEKTYELNTKLHDSFAVINRGPADRFWALGSDLVGFEDLKTIRRFSGHLVTVHHDLDLAASLDVVEKRIDLWKFSSGKKLRSVAIDDFDNQIKSSGTRKRVWKYNRDAADPVLQFDHKNQYLFCGQRSSAFLVPYQDLAKQAAQQVLVKPLPVRNLHVGKGLKHEFELTNEKLSADAEFKLVSGPESARLDGNTFTWTPAIGDIGDHQLVISGSANGISDQVSMNVSVRGNEIDLGITTQSWAVSPSGKYAIAWGMKSNGRQGFGGGSFNQDSSMDIVIVDLSKGEILNSEKNDKKIQAAAIDDKYIYILAQNSNVLNRHDVGDLNVKKRVFLPGTGTSIVATADQKVIVHYRDNNRGLSSMHQAIIDPETLKTKNDDPRTGRFGHSTSYFSFLPLEKGEVSDGRHVYDSESGVVKYVLQAHDTGLPLVDDEALRSFQTNFGSMPMAKRWGRTYDRSSLRDGRGNQICQMQYPFSMSIEYPIGVGFRSDQSRSGRTTTITGEFKFFDLTEGSEIGTQTLFKESGNNRSTFYPSGGQGELIQLRGKTCHTLYNGKIYSAPIPAEILAKAKTPLRILNPGSLHVDLSKPQVKIQLQTPGYDDVEFSLVNSIKHVKCDESGLITIDTAKIWQDKVSRTTANNSPFARIRSSRMSEQQKGQQEEARRRYGIGENQLGYLLPLSVKATGDDGQSDQLQFCLVAVGDKKIVDQKKNQLAQQMIEQQRKMAEEQKRRQAMIEKARADAALREEQANRNDRGDRGDSSEVEDLKKKVKRLEAVIDSLIGRLEKLEAQNKSENKNDR